MVACACYWVSCDQGMSTQGKLHAAHLTITLGGSVLSFLSLSPSLSNRLPCFRVGGLGGFWRRKVKYQTKNKSTLRNVLFVTLLKIPIGRRQTSWLFTKRDREFALGTIEKQILLMAGWRPWTWDLRITTVTPQTTRVRCLLLTIWDS